MFRTHMMAHLSGTGRRVGTGWIPSVPDRRDYTEKVDAIAEITKALQRRHAKGKKKTLSAPASIDLRQWCSPVEDQLTLGSCTAQAAVGVVEYFQNRAFGQFLDGSRLFVYKTTRNLMQVTGDTGAWLRNTMGALVHCGVPHEQYWPYTDADPDFDVEPPSFVYAVADNYEALYYFCHDPLSANVSGKNVLASVKKYLAYGIPSMFGFWGFPSSESSDVPGGIAYPAPWEPIVWGHAVVAVGYNNGKKIKNKLTGKTTTGALLIRNSWGVGWGDQGYGWLPYAYVEDKLALDFWSLLSMEWVNNDNFDIT